MSGAPGFSEHLPEPRVLWTRFRPRGWQGAAGPWLDLVGGGLGGPTRGAAPEPGAVRALDDVPYLPPPAPGERDLRDRLATAAIEAGIEPVIQLAWGEPAPALTGGPCRLLVDCLPALLAVGSPEAGAPVPPVPASPEPDGTETILLVPVLPGLGERLLAWLDPLLRASAAARIHVYEPRLSGAELRRLAEGAGGALDFDALFHGDAVEGGAVMRAARRAGLRVLHARPVGPPPPVRRERRSVAGLLAQAADLWLRAGRPVEEGQMLFRAARECDRASWDLAALAREGNLKVLDWLEGPAASLVESWLATGEAPLLDELIDQVL